MQEREMIEIGKQVFSTTEKVFPFKFPIESSFQKIYFKGDLIFFHHSKVIVDYRYNTCWKFTEFKKHIKKLIDEEYQLQKDTTKKINDLIDANDLNEQTREWLQSRFTDSEARISDAKKWLSRLDIDVDKFGQVDLNIVKQVPITNYMDFKGGFAKCIFGHEEKLPSLKYYEKTNSVFCFSCKKSGDVIEVYMALNNCDFKTAIKQIK